MPFFQKKESFRVFCIICVYFVYLFSSVGKKPPLLVILMKKKEKKGLQSGLKYDKIT